MNKPKSIPMVRKDLMHMKPYLPDRNKEVKRSAIWMDSNENPFSIQFGRYPNPTYLELRKKIGAFKSVDPAHIFVSNGSDEAIDLLIRAFCAPTIDRITTLVPGFETYRHCAQLSAIGVDEIRMSAPFSYTPEILNRVLLTQNKILFLCSPNNPTGKSISNELLIQTLEKWDGMVVLDEAYIDFAPYPSRISLIEQYPNLVILQTFSKAWGLASLRVGMTFAHEKIIRTLESIKLPYNLSSCSVQQVIQKLESNSGRPKFIEEWQLEKERMIAMLQKCNQVEHIESSDANFMLIQTKSGPDLYKFLVAKGIFVRLRKEKECEHWIRLSVGTFEENNRCIQFMNDFDKRG